MPSKRTFIELLKYKFSNKLTWLRLVLATTIILGLNIRQAYFPIFNSIGGLVNGFMILMVVIFGLELVVTYALDRMSPKWVIGAVLIIWIFLASFFSDILGQRRIILGSAFILVGAGFVFLPALLKSKDKK